MPFAFELRRTWESDPLNTPSPNTLLLGLSLMVLYLGGCSSPKKEAAPPHASFTIESVKPGETRRINVYLPPSYAQRGTEAFPVLYMPDGGIEEDFPHIATTIDTAIRNGEMRAIVLVGIENTERRRDMTGPTQVAKDREVAPRVGGSEAFRAFIEVELMPEIRKRYRVSDDTGIIGESAAGLFIVETFFLRPKLFRKVIALSPSLWWNNAELVRRAAERLRANPDLNAELYLSSANEEDIVPHVARLAKILESEAPPGLHWKCEPRPDLRHNTIYRSLSPRVLRSFYPPN